MPILQRMRPDHPWEDVARNLNRESEQKWSVDRLRRSVNRLVHEGLADPGLVSAARRRLPEDPLMSLITGIANANPDLTLREIAAQLETSPHHEDRQHGQIRPSSTCLIEQES